MTAFWIAFGAVFLAELGDKSQLLTLTFATRYRSWHVLVSVSIVAAVLQGLSVLVGSAVAQALPTRALNVIAGVAFIAFGLWTLRADEDSAEEEEGRRFGRHPIAVMSSAFLLAEFGDKTMLATLTLATTQAWLGTWVGATLGMVAANVIAIAVGRQLAARLSARTIAVAAAVMFFAFGALLLYQGFRG